jgi:hypothetical protein
MMNKSRGRRKSKMARTKSDSFKRNVKFYDENFDRKTTPVEGKIVSYKTYQEALAAFGNDEAKVLDALNEVSRQKQIADAVSKVSGGMEEKYIMAFIRPMRSVAPFSEIEKDSEQTAAILAQVKQVPFLLESLKSYCANKAAEGDSDDDSE